MSGSSSVLEAFGPRPLSAAEWAEAQRVWDRLRAELGGLIGTLPEHARHASGLARELDVLRVTCQRVVSALASEPGSPAPLAKLPGPEGLRQFVSAFRRTGVPAPQIEGAAAAVNALERLITVTGGSQTKLNERLAVSGGGGAGPAGTAGVASSRPSEGPPGALATQAQRQALHEAASAVTGRACETSFSIYAFRPHPQSPLTLERALCKGLIGAVVAPGGLPLVLGSGDTLHTEEAALAAGLSPQPHGRTRETILSAFTTSPLPTITSKSRTGSLHQVIDPSAFAEGAADSRPVDVVTALKACHLMYDPQTGTPTLDAVWSLVNCPSARLIFDVYLHADMERLYRPSIDALIWGPDLNAPVQDRWTTRLPNQPRLQLLGRGLAHAASEHYARHADVTAAFYHHIGWDPDDFVGFRCELRYPVWRAGYCMGFEYLGAPGPRATAD